jgi:hypothetical protein
MSSPENTKLIRLLAMIGSDHDGEALNAARLAHKLAMSMGGWEVVLGSATPHKGAANRAAGGGEGKRASNVNRFDSPDVRPSGRTVKPPRRTNWRQWATDLIDREQDCLSPWEIKFFGSFGAGRYPVPSDKQRAVFERVAERLDLELPETR